MLLKDQSQRSRSEYYDEMAHSCWEDAGVYEEETGMLRPCI